MIDIFQRPPTYLKVSSVYKKGLPSFLPPHLPVLFLTGLGLLILLVAAENECRFPKAPRLTQSTASSLGAQLLRHMWQRLYLQFPACMHGRLSDMT